MCCPDGEIVTECIRDVEVSSLSAEVGCEDICLGDELVKESKRLIEGFIFTENANEIERCLEDRAVEEFKRRFGISVFINEFK